MPTTRISSTMYTLAIVGLIAVLSLLFSEQIQDYRNPNQKIKSLTVSGDVATVVLKRNRYGHYIATGELNGVAAEFLLDTGATDVAVSASVAAAAGLETGLGFEVSTANGVTIAYATLIDSLRLGDIVEHKINGSIVPSMNEFDVLLGMSFLKRLDFSQSGSLLVLKSRRLPSGKTE